MAHIANYLDRMVKVQVKVFRDMMDFHGIFWKSKLLPGYDGLPWYFLEVQVTNSSLFKAVVRGDLLHRYTDGSQMMSILSGY